MPAAETYAANAVAIANHVIVLPNGMALSEAAIAVVASVVRTIVVETCQ